MGSSGLVMSWLWHTLGLLPSPRLLTFLLTRTLYLTFKLTFSFLVCHLLLGGKLCEKKHLGLSDLFTAPPSSTQEVPNQ